MVAGVLSVARRLEDPMAKGCQFVALISTGSEEWNSACKTQSSWYLFGSYMSGKEYGDDDDGGDDDDDSDDCNDSKKW